MTRAIASPPPPLSSPTSLLPALPLEAKTGDDQARYRALQARDARFDGHFFTGVTSTGVYCRPVCAVRTPKPENCRFFALAAQAEHAGFRPCLRCRPEVAPQSQPWLGADSIWSLQDASAILVQQAVQLLEAPEPWAVSGSAIAQLARTLGVSDRHLRRIFEARLGISPLQYLQTRRLLTAKQLLTDTPLPVTQVALASGFGSLRRFNAAFQLHYGMNPSALRRTGAGHASARGVRLAWRPPLDVAALLGFFATRQWHGVEAVHLGPPAPGQAASPGTDAPTLRRSVRLLPADTGLPGPVVGWISVQFDVARCSAWLQTSESLFPVLPLVIRRVRALLDLDADPAAIDAVLAPFFPHSAGLRVPGAWDGFELAVRAVLGQQITVAAARTLGQRLVEQLGEPLSTPWPDVDRLFPPPAVLAAVPGEVLGQLGIVRQRQAAIRALAQAVDSGALSLQAGAPVPRTLEALCALPGIGDWTAQYIAMRALRWPDAFPAGDVALHKALGVQGQPQPGRAALQASQAWRPWRSYAVVRAWHAGKVQGAGDMDGSGNLKHQKS